MIAVQSPISVQFDAAWISVTSTLTEVKNPAVLDRDVHGASLYVMITPLDSSTATNCIKTSRMVYLTCCLMPMMIMGSHLPQESWVALCQRA